MSQDHPGNNNSGVFFQSIFAQNARQDKTKVRTGQLDGRKHERVVYGK
jgi:hypothetical protein